MRLLFVGGTRFSGLAAAQQALARGHQVDVFHRGKSQAPGLQGARELIGDRNADLSPLDHGEWAHAAGLRCRPLPDTARDTLAWLREAGAGHN